MRTLLPTSLLALALLAPACSVHTAELDPPVTEDATTSAVKDRYETPISPRVPAPAALSSAPEAVAVAQPAPEPKVAEKELQAVLSERDQAESPKKREALRAIGYLEAAPADDALDAPAEESRADGGDVAGAASGLLVGSKGKAGAVGGVSGRSTGPAPSSAASAHPPMAPPPPVLPDRTAASTGTEQYTEHGLNPVTLTVDDRMSTFSVDVDTASYTIARRKLESGQLPPTASVRVEEFVNFVPYDYPAPAWGSDAPFAVYLEAAPNPWNPGHHTLRVGLKGQEIDQSDRNPVHLTFLVDVSGSMASPDKLGLAQKSLHTLVENLGPKDTVAVATYAGAVRRVLSPTSVGRDAPAIHRAIDDLSAQGSTAMSSGIDLAYQMASATYVDGHENRVIVLSDGDANVGPASHQEILTQIEGYARRGITLTTVGLGMGNYKDTLMEQLANKGDGNYYYVDSAKEADRVFGDDLSGTLAVIAKDVKIQVEFNPEAVLAYRLVGYENRDIADRDFRNDKVDAGEIGSGHRVTAVYDVVLADAGSVELATVRLRAKKPGPESPAREWNTTFAARDLHSTLDRASADFRLALAASGFAEKLRGSPHMAEVTWAELAALARGAARSGVEAHAELERLIRRAGELSGEGSPVAGR